MGFCVMVRRALLSCYDKTGLDAFAKALAALGIELIASGGTADFLKQHGLRVKTVEEFTGAGEQLDGRVKTLHPKIHAAILARRDDPEHVTSVGAGNLIDLVVVNLYPFERTAQQPGVSLEAAVEQIDIGGVALLRAAAKNFAHVGVVCQPPQYGQVIDALRSGQGRLPPPLTQQLAVEAFRLTSAYDTWIAGYLGGRQGALTESVTVSLRLHQPLRYGENPHQQGAWYVPADAAPWGLGTIRQLQGKELSYNNLLDADAALRCLLDFSDPTCVIVKHHAPCGMAGAATPSEAYERAMSCDPESAFGGIVGVNRPIDRPLAERLTETFLEVIVAPAVEADAAARLAKKPNVRVVTLHWPAAPQIAGAQWRQLSGSWLRQDADTAALDERSLKTVTTRAPLANERADLFFAWTAVKHAQSNGIVLAHERATVGIGQGQPSRVGSVRLAIQKAGQRSRGSVAASDGFFPFPDNIELLAQAGVTAIIQPGGSVKDAEVIDAANKSNLAMLLTGMRHFRH
jgi:phosphoribosylaminoimidazolecarboxamide formyltransferase/IMP cyclohydrolase